MAYTSLKYRIKDEKHKKVLVAMANSVNYVWNYCNESFIESRNKLLKNPSRFDLHKLTSGCSKELGITNKTVEAVCDQYINSISTSKKHRLSWRSHKRNLGWIPFKGQCLTVDGDFIFYKKNALKLWLSRPIIGCIKCGSFASDSLGNWFVSIVIEIPERDNVSNNSCVGVDLGLKNIVTLSSGESLSRTNITDKYKEKLAKAQRARKKRLVKSIHQKIKNTRNDWSHKTTTQLVCRFGVIVVGDVCSSKLKKTRMAKSVSDAGWYLFKQMLVYKANKLGIDYKEVNESFSTVTCSSCGSRTGPKGQAGLKVRDWICLNCGTSHDRDVNAAMNILLSAQGIERQRESIVKVEDAKTSKSS